MKKTRLAELAKRHVLVGVSPWACQMREDIGVVAEHSATVLIMGPSGTGKELIARSIHEQSRRADRPFVPVDCAAASGSLFVSQMFGHERGAFTGASNPSLGAFRAADGGTLFLDELGELELELQAKLLRTLQERIVSPVGGTQQIPVDVRVIAATNRDLQEEVRAGRFREDLYFRLNAVTLMSTPLASRCDDLEPLADFLLSRLEVRHGIPRKRLTQETWEALLAYSWPGNTRELENVLERATLFCREAIIERRHLPAAFQSQIEPTGPLKLLPLAKSARPSKPPASHEVPRPHFLETNRAPVPAAPDDAWPTLDEWTRKHVAATLLKTGFNQTDASRLLGIERNALRRLAQRLGIDLSTSRAGRPTRADA